MRIYHALIFTATILHCAFGQTYTIQTVAGGGLPVNIAGTSASLIQPAGVALDRSGNVFVAEGNVVLRLDAASGILTLVAGNGTSGYSGDGGPATSAQMSYPAGIAVDASDSLYIADSGNNVIRKVANGIITTVAGNGDYGYGGDNGTATKGQLADPQAIAVDTLGNLYIADYDNHCVRRVTNGVMTTVAGTGTRGYSGDGGTATSAQLAYPQGVAVDFAGNLYIADKYNHRIRKVQSGVITTGAGTGAAGYNGYTGTATNIRLNYPSAVTLDASDNLYITDEGNGLIRRVTSAGALSTLSGLGYALDENVPALTSAWYTPRAIAVSSAGAVYVADMDRNRVRKILSGLINTVAGGGTTVGDNGPATAGQLSSPVGVALDAAGNLLISDSYNNRIRKVTNGIITSAVGTGTDGFGGDGGPAASAQLYLPADVAMDGSGNLYIADSGNGRVRKVSNGVISTVAGNGNQGYTGDSGRATSAQLYGPSAVAVDSAGDIYIADTYNNVIREVSNGVITTVAGNGQVGYGGDHDLATNAQLGMPMGVAVDASGNLYIADTLNNRVRKVSGGVITTVAGTGTSSFGGDGGLATNARLNYPSAVALDSAGVLYIADGGNARIRKITNGVITTVAGGGTSLADNVPATSAVFGFPMALTISPTGQVYVADENNNLVRVLTPAAVACTYSLDKTSFTVAAEGGSVTTSTACAWSVAGLPAWVTVSGAASGTGSATVTLTVAANTGAQRTASFTVAGTTVQLAQAATAVVTNPVVITSINVAGGGTDIAQNTWVEIHGSGLAPASLGAGIVWNDAPDFASGRMPTQLQGVSVSINGKPAYIYFISAAQINVLTPLDSTTGQVQVRVTNGANTSDALAVNLTAAAPGFLRVGATYIAAEHTDYSLLGPAAMSQPGYIFTPAKPGETIVLFGDGFGLPVSALTAGSNAQSGALPTWPRITIGGTQAAVQYAGLISPGLYQINVVVPADAANGDNQVIATYGGVSSPDGAVISVAR